MFCQQPGSLCGKVRCNFLDDIASAFPEAPIALGFLQRGVLLLLQSYWTRKDSPDCRFSPLSKTIGKRSKRCFVSGGLRLSVLWSAGDIETAK